MAAWSRNSSAVATCSARGAQAPTWPRMSRMAAITARGPMHQPTRTPVAANALEMPSTNTVYRATSGSARTGISWRALPKVSIQ